MPSLSSGTTAVLLSSASSLHSELCSVQLPMLKRQWMWRYPENTQHSDLFMAAENLQQRSPSGEARNASSHEYLHRMSEQSRPFTGRCPWAPYAGLGQSLTLWRSPQGELCTSLQLGHCSLAPGKEASGNHLTKQLLIFKVHREWWSGPEEMAAFPQQHRPRQQDVGTNTGLNNWGGLWCWIPLRWSHCWHHFPDSLCRAGAVLFTQSP